MGQALYRKYRSKTLSEIVGQEHITETLDKALKSGRISHAYLFTGPRGVGKTSIARILAHEINAIPYQDDRMHMDIIEIDAASNRRIDEIRELRDKVAVAPTSAKYKVYIIDEVHMLTKEAFNALLKTLEEPPAHVVFILATTDAHKLPDTIVSRTQRYAFKPVTQDKVIAHLRQIATTENITVEDGALTLLAAHGEGSFRDSISMLDQASSHGGTLTEAGVRSLLGIPPDNGLNEIIVSLSLKDAPLTARNLNSLFEQGFQAAMIAKALSKILRAQLLAGLSPLDGATLMPLLARLLEVPVGHDPDKLLEIVLLEAAGSGALIARIVPAIQPVQTASAATEKSEQITHKKPEKLVHKTVAKPAVSPAPAQAQEKPHKVAAAFDDNIWSEVLNALKQKYNTLYGVVRMAEPTIEGSNLELSFSFAFHQKRVSDPKNKKILADIIFSLSGQNVGINCVVAPKELAVKPQPAAKKQAQPTSNLSDIENIFGGAEVL